MHSLHPVEIPMIPSGSISWNCHETPEGTLYVNPDLSEDVNPMQLFHTIQNNPYNYEPLGNGDNGVVRSVGGFAVKEFDKDSTMAKYRMSDEMVSGGLQDLRANVALAEGLKRVSQIPEPEVGFDVRGVELHAAYVPNDMSRPDTQILWLMEKLEPIKGITFPEYPWAYLSDKALTYYPSFIQLRKLYRSAFWLVGVDSHHINLDDAEANRIITKLPTASSRGVITRIDMAAERNKLNF